MKLFILKLYNIVFVLYCLYLINILNHINTFKDFDDANCSILTKNLMIEIYHFLYLKEQGLSVDFEPSKSLICFLLI